MFALIVISFVLETTALRGNGVDGVRYVGNMGISAVGPMLKHLTINPTTFGDFLTDVGNGSFYVTEQNGHTSVLNATTQSVWPELKISAQIGRTNLSLYAFAPISPRNISIGFLPTIIIRLRVVGTPLFVAYSFDCLISSGFCPRMFANTANNISCQRFKPFSQNTQHICVNTTVGNSNVDLVIGYYSDTGVYSSPKSPWTLWLDSPTALSQFVMTHTDILATEHRSFVTALPVSGMSQTDASIRWFVQSAVLLTKGVNNQVITMGYVELNQRDSFWTTWIHLYMWPQLDRAMLNQSANNQCGSKTAIPPCFPTGKIPTTILPRITRDDNIDITAYFILRVWRHFEWTRDIQTLSELYPAVKNAVSYLASRDVGDGVPAAKRISFWADWKDVSYVKGRKYAPHFDLLYLAAVNVSASMADILKLSNDAKYYRTLFDKGFAFVNRDVSKGGMWTKNDFGGHYIDVWTDKRTIKWILEDQVEGIFHGAVTQERSLLIFASLNASGSEGTFGIRETYPYIDSSLTKGQDPGHYHNGGIWPWLNCVDVVTRMEHGKMEEGKRIFDKLANSMFYNQPNKTPKLVNYEWMEGDTGIDNGGHPQGWNAACVLVTWRGYFGLRRLGISAYSLSIRIRSSSIVTVLPLAPQHGFLRIDMSLGWPPNIIRSMSPSGLGIDVKITGKWSDSIIVWMENVENVTALY